MRVRPYRISLSHPPQDYDGVLGSSLEKHSTVTNSHDRQMPRVLTPATRSLVLWLSTAISIVFCLFRLWLRKWRGQRLTYGDYWILLTLPFMVLNVGAGFFVNVHYTPLELVKGMYRRRTQEELDGKGGGGDILRYATSKADTNILCRMKGMKQRRVHWHNCRLNKERGLI